MKSQASPGEKSQVILEIEVEMAEVEPKMKNAARKIAPKVNIPGFRKGKAPYHILLQFVGGEAILEEALEEIVMEAYEKAIKEHEIIPMARPDIDIKQMEVDKPVIFTAEIITRPEVKLGEYKKLPLTKRVYEVTEEDLDAEVTKVRERLVRTERAPEDAVVEKGDTAMIDFKGFVDGQPFKGGDAKDYPLEIGSGAFIPGFEEQVMGMKKGEEKDIEVTFPQDYPRANLAGKAAKFQVILDRINRKYLPELDMDLVNQVTEDCESVEDFLADVKKTLTEDKDSEADGLAVAQAVETVVKNSEVEVPSKMISEKLDSIIMELEYKFADQGIKFDDYLTYAKMTRDDLKKEYYEQAEQELEMQLVLHALSVAEGLEVTEEDIDKQINLMAEKAWQDPISIRNTLEKNKAMDELKENIFCNKAGKFIYDNAVVTVEHVTKEQAEAEAAAKIAAEAAAAQEAVDALDATDEPKKAAAKKTTAKKAADTKKAEKAEKSQPKKAAAKKTTAKKAADTEKEEKAEKAQPKKAAAKKTTAKKAADTEKAEKAEKAQPKKAAAKKTTAKKKTE
ncbi:MAG: trigger factor [Bacillota bacterium]|jgi:trigger factor